MSIEQDTLNARLSNALEKSKVNLNEFAPVYEAFVDRIYSYCRHRTGSTQDAEDLTAQVFQRAMERCHTYRGKYVGAWLFKIAYHITVDFYRSQKHEPVSDEVLINFVDRNGRSPVETVIHNERLEMLQSMLDDLDEEKRNLLLLRITGELSSAEIGEIVGKSAGAVRVEVHRIIQELKQKVIS